MFSKLSLPLFWPLIKQARNLALLEHCCCAVEISIAWKNSNSAEAWKLLASLWRLHWEKKIRAERRKKSFLLYYAKEKLMLTFLVAFCQFLVLENQSKIHHCFGNTRFGIRISHHLSLLTLRGKKKKIELSRSVCAKNGSNFSWWIEHNLKRW